MENPQGQVSFLKRRRRVTTTPSGPKVTVSTEAPGMASILLNAVVARTCPPGLSVCCSKLRKPTGPARARRACQRWTFRALSIDLSGCSFTRASAPKSAKNYPWEPEESPKKGVDANPQATSQRCRLPPYGSGSQDCYE